MMMGMRALLGLILFAGCATDPPSDEDYPVQAGGGTVAGDTGLSSGGGTGTKYQVCVVTDPRDLHSCMTTGVGGLRVELGGKVGGTYNDGSVFMDASVGMGNHFKVTGMLPDGTQVVPAILPFGFGGFGIPVITVPMYEQMMTANGVQWRAGEAAIMAAATMGGAPAVGATGRTLPLSTYPVFYDGASPTAWTQTATGSFGTVWAPGVPTTMPAVITVLDSTGMLGGGASGILTEAGAITFSPAVIN
jgi:hypothetical protein